MRTPSLAPVLRALLVICAFPFCAPCASPAMAQTTPVAVSQSDRVPKVGVRQLSSAPVRLAGHIPGWANLTSDRGTVPDATSVQLTFGLSRSPALEAAFTSFVAAQSNPGTPAGAIRALDCIAVDIFVVMSRAATCCWAWCTVSMR